MSEQQAQTAKAVYEQLVAARQELAQLRAIRPLLCGVTLHAGPGVAPVRVDGVQAERLTCAANAAENALRGRIADLEAKLSEL
jgi:uncharacterized protein involved in exopolysaccharide biosynthesis